MTDLVQPIAPRPALSLGECWVLHLVLDQPERHSPAPNVAELALAVGMPPWRVADILRRLCRTGYLKPPRSVPRRPAS